MQINQIIKRELEALKTRIVANHFAAGQIASGKTMQSLQVVLFEDGGILYGRDFFGTLENGRKAGGIPRNYTQIILQWMEDKGIQAEAIPYIREPSIRWQPKYTPQERGNMAMAGAIAHTHRTRGSKLYREGGRKDIYTNEISTTINAVSRAALQQIGLTIESINDRLNNDSD